MASLESSITYSCNRLHKLAPGLDLFVYTESKEEQDEQKKTDPELTSWALLCLKPQHASDRRLLSTQVRKCFGQCLYLVIIGWSLRTVKFMRDLKFVHATGTCLRFHLLPHTAFTMKIFCLSCSSEITKLPIQINQK